MTREEAIKNLNEHKTEFTCDFGWNTSVIESLDMAIKALEQMEVIEAIIKSPIDIQEDVLRYKMICEVVKK